MLAIALMPSCGGAGSSGGGGGTPPAAPTGLTATPGNAQVSLTWNASSGATSYQVSRGTVTGGPYTPLVTQAGKSYTDSALTNGAMLPSVPRGA